MSYEFQAVGHDASIRAEHPDDDTNKVEVTITIGEHAEARITMWAEEFANMAREVWGPGVPLTWFGNPQDSPGEADEYPEVPSIRQERDAALAEVVRLNRWINEHAYDRHGFKL